MDQLQLYTCKIPGRVPPAVEVKQNARPPRHDAAIVPSGPARGIENKRPMTSTYTM